MCRPERKRSPPNSYMPRISLHRFFVYRHSIDIYRHSSNKRLNDNKWHHHHNCYRRTDNDDYQF